MDQVMVEILNSQIGLTEAVKRTGALYEDSSQVTFPSFLSSMWQLVFLPIYRNMPEDPDHPEVKFALDFVEGNRNNAIERRVPKLLEYR